MKAVTYEISGCAVSQSYKQTGEFDSMSEANRAAREANQSNADGLGLSFRGYKKRSKGVRDGLLLASPASTGIKPGAKTLNQQKNKP